VGSLSTDTIGEEEGTLSLNDRSCAKAPEGEAVTIAVWRRRSATAPSEIELAKADTLAASRRSATATGESSVLLAT
jgi:hypothetical protein